MSSFLDRSLRWTSISNFQNSSPFSESTSQSIIFSASFTKSVESLGSSFTVGSADWDETGVDLDTAVDISASEELAEFL